MSFDEELPEDHVAILVEWPNRLGGPMHEIKAPVQKLWLKCRGAYTRRGVNMQDTMVYVACAQP